VGSALLLQSVSADMLAFPVYDTNDSKTGFKEGLYTHVKVIKDQDPTIPLEQFLLCTSCTISYIFGDYDDFASPKSTQKVQFKKGGGEVTINFIETNLSMVANDKDETMYNWTMDVAWIAPEFQNETYFDNFKENMLGLAPMKTESMDEAMLARQFLYQFTQAGD